MIKAEVPQEVIALLERRYNTIIWDLGGKQDSDTHTTLFNYYQYPKPKYRHLIVNNRNDKTITIKEIIRYDTLET